MKKIICLHLQERNKSGKKTVIYCQFSDADSLNRNNVNLAEIQFFSFYILFSHHFYQCSFLRSQVEFVLKKHEWISSDIQL